LNSLIVLLFSGFNLLHIWGDKSNHHKKKKIVPNHYYKKVYNRLQSLYQGSRSIDKYFKKMEITIIKNNVFEDREATITWFLNGLDR
jgi:hypothetical protein